ncbi:hypothetical protein OA977_02850 [Pelagibacteraceae bacterium]|nr:hypothetical protein [Pelagibacteraceae bacterium]
MRVFVALSVLTLMVLIVWIRQEGIEVIENFYILALYSILTIIFLGLSINSMLDKRYLNAFIYFFLWNVFVIWWFHVGWIGALIYF